jgi:hypothetical protein
MKQIGLALQSFATAHGGRLPAMGLNSPYTDDGATLVSILPFLDRGELIPWKAIPDGRGGTAFTIFRVRLYMSPADPSYAAYPDPGRVRFVAGDPGDCSYAVNMVAFGGRPNLTNAFPDGTSNTIGLTERYARCGVHADFGYNMAGLVILARPEERKYHSVERRATFADKELGDVVPPAAGQRPPAKTCQVGPAPQECDPSIAQTPHPGGMLTAMVDGSVRTTAATITPAVFWAEVAPADGELVPPPPD